MKPMIKKLNFLSLSICILFFLGSCQKELITEGHDSLSAKAQINKAKNHEDDEENTETSEFPTYHQGFNHETHPWADNSMEGFWGWCGTVTLKNRKSGDLKPSAGLGYATVEFGACNEYWVENFGDASGPATFDAALWSESWPDSGFIHELDIYLDADQYDFDNGLAFSYANSLYYSALPYPFIYFGLDVEKVEGSLEVNGYEVPEEGWYTFREVFGEDTQGHPTVEFQLLEHGKLLYSTELTETLFGGEPTTSLMANDLGSGYIWFPAIAEGVALAIDEYRLRPGK